MGQLKHEKQFLLFCMRQCILGSTNKMDKPKFSQFHCEYQALLRSQNLKKMEIIIIIISQTTNFIAAFHGLYLPAAHSHSFQLFILFDVNHIMQGLTMELLFQRPKVRNSLGKNAKSTFLSKFNQHL